MADLLAAIRDRVEADLGDSSNLIWSTAELDRHIAHALEDLSRVDPQDLTTTAVASGSPPVVNLGALVPLPYRLEAIEYPLDLTPRAFVRFTLWDYVVALVDGDVPSGSTVRVWYTAEHTLTTGTTTLDEQHEDILILGAVGYALRSQAIKGVNTLNTGGANVDRDYRGLSADVLRDFRAALRSLARVRRQRLYEPVEPFPSQSTDPGP